MNKTTLQLGFLLVVLTSATGAQCTRRDIGTYATSGPRVLSQNPSLGDVMQVVNANSAKIHSLFTTDASLTVPDAPTLRANLALERKQRLRLRAETALTGAELDMGSNDEMFWLWVRRQQPTTIYFCRHTQFANSAAKQMIPVEPSWLLDAIGMASFDPALQHSPPQRNANGRISIQTALPGPTGQMNKITVVDEARGWVLEQHLYDVGGQLVASALTNRHWRDPASGAVVPQEIEIRWPATNFNLKFDVRQWQVNSTPADPNQLFAMPVVPGWTAVDLADPALRTGTPVSQQPLSAPPASVARNTGLAPLTSVMGPMFTPPGPAGQPMASDSRPFPAPVSRRY
jgi:hypothetical protein